MYFILPCGFQLQASPSPGHILRHLFISTPFYIFIVVSLLVTLAPDILRPATHPDLIGISRFFSRNLGVSRFADSTCENPEFLFHFEIGKTKGRLTLLHPQSLG